MLHCLFLFYSILILKYSNIFLIRRLQSTIPPGSVQERLWPTQTVSDTPLWQEAAVHQDQNLTPQEELLPDCRWPHQQGPGSPLCVTLTTVYTPESMSYIKGVTSRICQLLFENTTFKVDAPSLAQSGPTSGGPTCLQSGNW